MKLKNILNKYIGVLLIIFVFVILLIDTCCKGQIWREALTGMEFILLPPGEFMMDSEMHRATAKPPQRLYINGFWLGKYEVTQGQWKAVMTENPSRFKKGDNYPVDNVSWKDVQEFINKLSSRTGKSFRLPCEVEWEYACRAGLTGNIYTNLDKIAWYWDESNDWEMTTHPVGQKRPNVWGLYDMVGNVSEWCQDWTSAMGIRIPKYPSKPDPEGILAHQLNRIYRGGSFRDSAKGMEGRVIYSYYSATVKKDDIGFRLVRTN